MLVRRPELFGAVVCAVPLLDMRRFNKLLAGASWMAEYGDPDTADWGAFMWRHGPNPKPNPNPNSNPDPNPNPNPDRPPTDWGRRWASSSTIASSASTSACGE